MPVPTARPAEPQKGGVSLELSSRTKLEHSRRECYMWITADPAARWVGERIGSARDGILEMAIPSPRPMAREARISPVTRVESGDGRKREQGDSGRKSRQGSRNPAHPGWTADRQSQPRHLRDLAR